MPHTTYNIQRLLIFPRQLPRIAAVLALASCGGHRAEQTLTLVTTTTVEDSGLLDSLVARFHQDHPEYHLVTVAVATGEALQYGKRKDADVILSHDASAESAFVAQGYGVERRPVMYNDFVIARPANDPARIRGDTSAVD